MKNYQQRKEAARQEAVEWQLGLCDYCPSMGELEEAGNYFYELGKRFGLIREFRENAIPC